MESNMKKTLRSLCLSYGWSYGVFWGFDLRNNLLLTMEDAYYEEHASNEVDNMLLQVHMLGEGKIGEAALDGKYRWMFLEDMKGHVSSSDDSERSLQISPEIKTIAVIPVELKGVLEFGSTKEIVETPEFLEQARKFLEDEGNFVRSNLAGNCSSSLNSDLTNQTGLLPSSNIPKSWEYVIDNIEDFWTFDSLSEKTEDHFGIEEFLIDPNFGSSLVSDEICEDIFEEHLASSDWPSSLFDSSFMEDLSQWLDDSSSKFPTELEGIVSDDVSQSTGRNDIFPSSLSYALDSSEQGGLLAELEIDIEFGKVEECFETIVNPFEGNSNSLLDTSVSPRKGLFSELGLDHLLTDISTFSSTAKSSIDEDPWYASKRRKTETYQTMYNQKYPKWDVNSGFLMPKSKIGVKVEKPTKEHIKGTKKRTRLGESRKPRPKDRQMIADRIKELRDLIPNGSKLSIDALLGRTVKHILFAQSLKKHAEILKLVNEPKLIGLENGSVYKGRLDSISSSRGATWAYEVGGSNLSCPIIVEDLRHPGQMLIEMLCEEQGYFLEIIDVVRGFGLTILKGVMESRDNKIWAHFIVEGNQCITRIDLFMSLMQLLQGTSRDEEISKSGTVAVLPEWRNCQQYNNQP